jgi:hypothetical protein
MQGSGLQATHRCHNPNGLDCSHTFNTTAALPALSTPQCLAWRVLQAGRLPRYCYTGAPTAPPTIHSHGAQTRR